MKNLRDRQIKSDRLKLILSIIWFAITFSMVTWWWIFSFRQLNSLADGLPHEKYQSLRTMLVWEGSILIAFILVGGIALLVLTSRERMRNLRLRLFFSNFSHDLKTSLSRLRLRTEVLAENIKNADLQELLAEVSRLDLQLENSLWVARGEEQELNMMELTLSDVIGQLRVEWPDMEIQLQKNAKVKADPMALRSVLRNILQNAWLHGEASRIDIGVESRGEGCILLLIRDNGKGFMGDLRQLGRATLPSSDREGNGIGLYLSQMLLEKMMGRLSFQAQPQAHSQNLNQGFLVQMQLQGVLG